MSEQEKWRRFRSRMSDGRPTTGFNDGAEIFETEQDADGAARLLDAAFSCAYGASEARIAELEIELEKARQDLLYIQYRNIEERTADSRMADGLEVEVVTLRELIRELLVNQRREETGGVIGETGKITYVYHNPHYPNPHFSNHPCDYCELLARIESFLSQENPKVKTGD